MSRFLLSRLKIEHNQQQCDEWTRCFGKNLFRYKTSDGYARGVLKAQGSSVAGSRWAKQFSQQGDLKAIGSWYEHIGAHVGTEITVSWVAPDEIELSYN